MLLKVVEIKASSTGNSDIITFRNDTITDGFFGKEINTRYLRMKVETGSAKVTEGEELELPANYEIYKSQTTDGVVFEWIRPI